MSKKEQPANQNNRKQKSRRTPLSKAVFSLILTLAIGVFLISGLKLLSISLSYKQAEDTYETIRRDASVKVDPELGYPLIDVQALVAENPDTAAYLYCEDVCDYPVVQTSDNDYYLHTMFNGEYNPAGTLFIDSRIPEGIEARNCIIYGHNMNDGSMFGQLHHYSDPEYYDQHRTFHVYTPGHHYLYKVVAAYTASVDGFTYIMDFADDEEFLSFLEQTKAASWFDVDTELTADSKIITLSTCLDNGDDYYRNVVILVRDSEITEDGSEIPAGESETSEVESETPASESETFEDGNEIPAFEGETFEVENDMDG